MDFLTYLSKEGQKQISAQKKDLRTFEHFPAFLIFKNLSLLQFAVCSLQVLSLSLSLCRCFPVMDWTEMMEGWTSIHQLNIFKTCEMKQKVEAF